MLEITNTLMAAIRNEYHDAEVNCSPATTDHKQYVHVHFADGGDNVGVTYQILISRHVSAKQPDAPLVATKE